MLVLRKDQPSLWESVLPGELLELPEELAKVDRLLEDERFFAPFRDKFSTRQGRPTVPVATYLRLMYLKYRYQMGYETLVKEVRDSITWRRFCHLSLEDPVPEASTLIKLTHKYGEATLRKVHRSLLRSLREKKVIRGRKLRLDTTVVEANIRYPTDSGLLWDGMKVITRTVTRIKGAGLALGVPFVNHIRKAKKLLVGVGLSLKDGASLGSFRLVRAKEELLEVAREVVARGHDVLAGAEAEVERVRPGVRKLVEGLEECLELTERVIRQTEAVLGGERHIPRRLVSLFDPGARPIVRGKARAQVEFGRKVVLGEAEHGIITTYRVVEGNPADTTLLQGAVKGHGRTFRGKLKALAADRGFYSRENEAWLKDRGVERVAIPARGRLSKERRAYERQGWFKRLKRFRAGIEARGSLLKRKFGLRRSLLRGGPGTAIWVGFGVLAHNLWQASRLI